jgi:hypothetical protein
MDSSTSVCFWPSVRNAAYGLDHKVVKVPIEIFCDRFGQSGNEIQRSRFKGRLYDELEAIVVHLADLMASQKFLCAHRVVV